MINSRCTMLLIGLLFLAGCGKAAPDPLQQIRAEDALDRRHAVDALQSKFKDPATVVPVLTEALADTNHYVRRDAARALGHYGPAAKTADPALIALLRDREPGVRKAAARALQEIDPEVAARLGLR